jgi:UDP-N-acetylglucosamine--N-acetylmuramyl-(pentapeptide) pyrophosphoryl-undecaprenol N-acetylglucosamine transferase
VLNNKRILFAAGGTGGHINPALAVAGLIRDTYPGAEIVFVGTAKKWRRGLCPLPDFGWKPLTSAAFSAG